ncbi:GNAT family N-acetyltransferase [Aureibacter tunicatorum]|uniref:Ribosomal-protein-alanine N-acetyltransferase n=1 Tax=Aureibacter tunicatorum TaxID=866807 RepID=A0AAE3XPP0_9BACT|nr:GNAT family N-acetyltransferase [Aureibacter tunicatorum]MDR6240307.1 ribosomal-protein-alanine N-acetyltransferase [Aureibacter tunicatorum]BDD05812.1 GNAT family N-acetyltransferase [Aureibacter tunicatorum]
MINKQAINELSELESERLYFRKIGPQDAEDIYSLRSQETTMRYMDSKYHQSLKDSEAFIQDNLSIQTKGEGMFFAIIEKESGAFVGDFVFWKIDDRHHRADIGYMLKPDFWGKGFMQETMKTLLAYAFDEVGIHSIEANVNPENGNSSRALLKIGFEKEAYFKENYYFEGKYLDSEIFSLLERNFIR